MNLYTLCLTLHLLAALLWFGHMFFWCLFAGPVIKRIEPHETGDLLRSLSLSWGGFGWPSLIVLLITGDVMLNYRGITLLKIVTRDPSLGGPGHLLRIKLILVGLMIIYQILRGHGPSRRLIYLDMLAAILIVGISVYLVNISW